LLAFAVPKEGIFTWLCGLTLLTTGKASKEEAYDFLDAWLSPETGKQLIEDFSYGHSNKKAFEIADPAKVAALGITDPEKALNAGIMLQKVDTDKYTKLWEEVKTMK
jgi:spermidine/putrescine-binding protein